MILKLKERIAKLHGKVAHAEMAHVTKFGNGAKIGFRKEYIGKKVLVVVLEKSNG